MGSTGSLAGVDDREEYVPIWLGAAPGAEPETLGL
jgi:hypothetical protein